MPYLHLVPQNTSIRFIGGMRHKIAFMLSALVVAAAIGLVVVKGLAFGIDFAGGILIEVRAEQGSVDIGDVRSRLAALDLGDVSVQEFGAPEDLLLRVQEQPGGESAQQEAVQKIRDAMGDGWEYRRTETVGPQVGDELIQDGILAIALAIGGILLYIWFRFEWQFGAAAVVALVHDVAITLGVFSLFSLEFNLSSIAAVLTIAGYSINDTVVVFDRVRENLRKYKTKPLDELFNLSINQTLSRTVVTSGTTLLALLALFFLGGSVIQDFSLAMIVGVIVGTYSSVFLAAPMLIVLDVRRDGAVGTGLEGDAGAEGAQEPGKG